MKKSLSPRKSQRKPKATRRFGRIEALEDRRLLAVLPPVAMNDLYRVGIDQPMNVSGPGVLANDISNDGPLAATLFSGPSNGALTLAEDGSFTYTPNTGYVGLDSFMYWASDNGVNSLLAAVTLRVSADGNGPLAAPDSYAVNEDSVLNIPSAGGVLDNDTPTSGGPLTAQLQNGPAHGTLAFNDDGSFTYTPSANYNGSDTFTYIAKEGDTSSEATTVSITVRAQNDKPTAANDVYSATEDESLVVDTGVLANDGDVDGDSLTAMLVSGPLHGSITLNEDGTFTYTPNADFHGIDGFSYLANDGTIDSQVATVTINVANVNDAPVAVGEEYSIDEDSVLTVDPAGILANDTDIDGDTLLASLVSGPANGTLTLNADGSFTYTPSANFFGSDSFTYTVSDGTATSELATVNITVNPVNDAPIANNDEYDVAEDNTLTIDAAGILTNDSDGDGDTLLPTIISGPQNGTLTLNDDGSFSYTPDANFNGIDGFSYQVSDGTTDSAVATVTINVTPVNDLPIANNDEYAVDEDSSLVIDPIGILANDSDADGDTLTPIIVGGPQHGALVLNDDGSFTYTPDADFNGTDGFSYQVSDGTGESEVATVTIVVAPVNDAPIANNDEYSIDEDSTLVIDPTGILANDSDLDGDTLTPVIVSGTQHGTLTLNADGSFSYTPEENFNGTDGFSYQVNDGITDSAVATVTINVGAVNDTPIANNDEYTVEEDSALIVDATGVLANDSDADGDTLVPTVISGPQHGTLVLNEDGSFSYTPEANYNGTDGFSYQVNDGVSDSSIATVTINVNSVNDAPVANNDEYNIDEDSTLQIDPTGILANDSDADGDTLTPVIVSGPQHGTLVLNDDGSFSYTPDENFNGTDGFSYQVSDGTTDSAVATVTINVGAVNDAPVAVDDTWTVEEDATLVVDAEGVLLNDTDIDGDVLLPSLVTGPEHGTLAINDDGSFSYTPDANFFGSDSFTYLVNDGSTDSNVATVTINITPVNDAPVAADDSYSVNEDEVLTVDATGVLANDSDIDGDALTAALLSGPEHGTLTLNADGSFSYTPDADYFGSDSFTYRTNDGTIDGGEATVSIEVVSVNDAPVATEDAYTIDEDTTLDVAAAGVLENDSDLEGDALNAVLVTGPTNGTLTLNSDGSFSYTPFANYYGSDSFVYKANDGSADSDETTVSITINPVPDAPIVNDDAYSHGEDTTLSGNVLANDFDPQGLALTAVLVDGPSHGTLVLNDDGSFSYTPDANYFGSDGFSYKAANGVEESEVTTVAITVQSINDAPVTVAEEYDATSGSALVIDAATGLLANDTDVEDDSLTARLLLAPAHGTLTLASDGSFTYTPTSGFVGEDRFFYQASDDLAYGNVVQVLLHVGEGSGGGGEENAPPQATGDSYIVVTGQTLELDGLGVLANDSDSDGDALTATVVTGPSHGNLVLGLDGSISYTPDVGYLGEDNFTYVANDGTVDSTPATVTITVRDETAENAAPLSSDDAFATSVNTPLSIDPLGVLANDTDPNNDPMTATVVTGPTHGTLVLAANGSFVYTPEDEFIGTDTFTYAASDGLLTGNTATVTITVSSTSNTRPNALNDQFVIAADTVLNVPQIEALDAGAAVGVLANDSDAQGDALTALLFSAPQHGTVVLESNGAFVYTPNAGFVGTDSFIYRAFDGQRYSALAAVTIRVTAPVALASFAFDEGTLDAMTTDEDDWMASAIDAFFGNDEDPLFA